ncbi:MAG: terpene cyclase/mutase family protein [Deltaproteobacteria bacterium]|nr:terpene cyclase/mutase family protein [Deltaproteobacteria bacterium]
MTLSSAEPTSTERHELRELAQHAMHSALQELAREQTERGAWWGDYGGPMFLLPMYVAACRYAGREIPEQKRTRMREYVANVQRPDGSIGLHAEGDGCMFTTALTYVMLRTLGAPAACPVATQMRGWIRDRNGPLGAASWGKFILAVMGVYEWEGLHPILPELWLLPPSAPFHPGRLWCHCRQVYLPMAYLYGLRATSPADTLTLALRDELYPQKYSDIDFAGHRDTLASEDAYRPDSAALRAANRAMDLFESMHNKALRAKALAAVYEHIVYEDNVTSDIKIGPVNAALDTLCHVVAGDLARAERGFAQLENWYLWEGHDGLKMQGYNSTELWDTAFALQAIEATPMAHEYEEMVAKAQRFVRDNQILEDVPAHQEHYRHRSRGGWPFSNRPHGWPITDCTAEGFKVALSAMDKPTAVDPALLRDSVRLMLSWQNDDGGWASYERQRGGAWLELLNPSQVFGDIMVDYSYVECTSAVLQALAKARAHFVGEFEDAIAKALGRGAAFLRSKQRDDGSFEGSWAVCFTYGTWFGVSGLLASGAAHADPAIVRACEFLLSKQRADGAWGEHPRSCVERRWIDHSEGHAANTSWALMTLVRAKNQDTHAMDRAAEWLLLRQEPGGAWPRESLVGVFNRTCLINYENYRRYFPLWALAEWHTHSRTSDL